MQIILCAQRTKKHCVNAINGYGETPSGCHVSHFRENVIHGETCPRKSLYSHSSFLIKKEPDIILPGSRFIFPFSKSRLLSGKRVGKSGTRGQQTVSPEVQRIFPRGTRGYGFITQWVTIRPQNPSRFHRHEAGHRAVPSDCCFLHGQVRNSCVQKPPCILPEMY